MMSVSVVLSSLLQGLFLQSGTHSQCDTRPIVTFPVVGHHCLLTGTNLHCFVTEQCACKHLTQGSRQRSGWLSNLRPLNCKSNALIITPLGHTVCIQTAYYTVVFVLYRQFDLTTSMRRIHSGIVSFTWFLCSSYSAHACTWRGLCRRVRALPLHLDHIRPPVSHGVAQVPPILLLSTSGKIQLLTNI